MGLYAFQLELNILRIVGHEKLHTYDLPSSSLLRELLNEDLGLSIDDFDCWLDNLAAEFSIGFVVFHPTDSHEITKNRNIPHGRLSWKVGVGFEWKAVFVEVEGVLRVELRLGGFVNQGIDFWIVEKFGKPVLVAIFEVVRSPDNQRCRDVVELLKHALIIDGNHLG